MKKYRSEITNLFVIFVIFLVVELLLSWTRFHDLEKIIKGFVLGVILLGILLMVEALGTYLKIGGGIVSHRSFGYWYKKIPIGSINRIEKQPHPIFKALSWSIVVYYREEGKERKFEIWPSFSLETIGKFLTDLKKINPAIEFDAECMKWMEKKNLKTK
jgi:hypothetical protein